MPTNAFLVSVFLGLSEVCTMMQSGNMTLEYTYYVGN